MQPVEPARALGAVRDQAGVLEQPQVARDGRAADRQRVGELADRAVALAQQLDDRPPVRVAERVERVAEQVQRDCRTVAKLLRSAHDRRHPREPLAAEDPERQSEYEACRDESLDPPALVVRVGKTELRYHLRAIEDLHAMLEARGDWMPLGSADEQKPAADGTVEAGRRSDDNPVGGWYGLKKGMRGRFGNYVPPVLEALGLAEVEHNPRNNRMRAR